MDGKVSLNCTTSSILQKCRQLIHIIVGSSREGGSLNYDELVVYTNDVIQPSFLVIYKP
ncbi:hypothetical protein B0H14DRAFT_2879104 [Mycena olivaceomarginata]|nr:hypothetical protein B0H14DRAFT_2879104 [Mycena olivaceomarginata]